MAFKTTTKTPFGIQDYRFINLYSEENPILSIGDGTYFLFNNLIDIHIPVIGYGIVEYDKFISGMDKIYHIKLLKIHSPKDVIEKFVYNRPFKIINKGKSKIDLIKRYNNQNQLKSDNNIFEINCFFCRKEYKDILLLQQEYIKIIKSDLEKQINEINENILK